MTIRKSIELFKNECIINNVDFKNECITLIDKMINDINECINNM